MLELIGVITTIILAYVMAGIFLWILLFGGSIVLYNPRRFWGDRCRKHIIIFSMDKDQESTG